MYSNTNTLHKMFDSHTALDSNTHCGATYYVVSRRVVVVSNAHTARLYNFTSSEKVAGEVGAHATDMPNKIDRGVWAV